MKNSNYYFNEETIESLSWEELDQGKMKIMELNGAGSEPGHIYHPGASIWRGYNSLFYHMRVLLRISRLNNKSGTPYMSWKDGWYVFTQLPTFKKMGLS